MAVALGFQELGAQLSLRRPPRSGSLDSHLGRVREVLLTAVLQQDAWPGVFGLAAAGIARRAQDLVRVCVLEERAAGIPWEKIGEPFGLTADAARKRWGHWVPAPVPEDDQL
ncbi:hypothetical protein [Streptomyces sp. NPDC059761]|uniref:hypothetical protein n=1 Tax=Streptomyces sp. NPDC059761 TaxID=3346937 RepID=UPI00365115B0